MTASKAMKLARKNLPDEVVSQARCSAFLNGVLEGLSGPLMLAKNPRLPVPDDVGGGVMVRYSDDVVIDVVASSLPTSIRRIAGTMARNCKVVADKRGVAETLVYEKRLDETGKFRSIGRIKLELRPCDDKPSK